MNLVCLSLYRSLPLHFSTMGSDTPGLCGRHAAKAAPRSSRRARRKRAAEFLAGGSSQWGESALVSQTVLEAGCGRWNVQNQQEVKASSWKKWTDALHKISAALENQTSDWCNLWEMMVIVMFNLVQQEAEQHHIMMAASIICQKLRGEKVHCCNSYSFYYYSSKHTGWRARNYTFLRDREGCFIPTVTVKGIFVIFTLIIIFFSFSSTKNVMKK